MAAAFSFVFDLDGTLIDSVYQNVVSWREAFNRSSIDVPVWRIHRRIGMSGGLMLRAISREIGRPFDDETIETLKRDQRDAYAALVGGVRALPGAADLLETLTRDDIPWAIATSGERAVAVAGIELLGLRRPPSVVITNDDIAHAKPSPEIFTVAADRLDVDVRTAFVVGDSTWDLLAARRCGALGIALLTGGYGRADLELAQAYRVFEDPADFLARLDELGIREE